MDSKGRKIRFDIAGVDLNSYLYSKDEIDAFDCGNKDLNEYLRNNAVKDTNRGTNNTTIFFQKDNRHKIVGYYSISAASYRLKSEYDFNVLDGLADDEDMALDRDLDFSAIKINNFAVSKDCHGKKIGTYMMLKLWYSLYLSKMVSNVGTSVMILDSLPYAADFYKKLGFSYVGRDYDDVPIYDPSIAIPMIIRFDDIVATIASLDLKAPENLYTFMDDFD